jgi:pimeloyl-ACP methyl ester carboxylesterase
LNFEVPPLVLVHGLSGSARWWRKVGDRLSERRDVHVLDVPPIHPHDAPRWLVAWLDGAGIDTVDLVGHSLGGLICARAAAAAPERVRRLALIAPAGIPTGRRLVGHAAPLAASLAQVPAYAPRIALDALRTGPALIRAALYAATHDLRTELGRLEAPTLLVWGERDRLVPARVAGEWLSALPDARLVRLDAGHVPMWDAPDELAAAVLDFLEEPARERRDEPRPRVVDGMGLAGDDGDPPAR